MIQRLPAHLSLMVVAAMSSAESAKAGVWVTEPVLGLAADYSTNPGLVYAEHSSETTGAVLIDAPTTYHADNASYSLQPSFRVANTSGYSAITSDYAHLTGVGELDTERGSLTLTGQIARDSSLYYNYSLNGSAGVRRDTTLADVAWIRSLTERLSFNWDLNTSRVIYGQSSSFTTLTDYHDTSAAPALSWNASERTTLKLSAGAGIYDATAGDTKSDNYNLQLGFVRRLTELWTLTANAGYSRQNDTVTRTACSVVFFGICFGPYSVTLKSTQNGTVFNANATRKGELLTMNLGASRSVVPTGFAFLATQTTYALSVDYPRTERWTFDAGLQRTTSKEPQALGPGIENSFLSIGLSAAWLVTEKWTLKLQATRVTARYTPPSADAAATGVTLQLSRRFNPVTWQ